MLTNRDVLELTALRRELHRFPEVSGAEAQTAARVLAALAPYAPDRVLTGLGGHGVAAVYHGDEVGPTVMIRCELDALPITELSEAEHRSTIAGNGHLCGHDGHMAIVLGLARLLHRARPKRGRVVLLFQPAEEDGAGAARVLADPRFAQIAPDWAFALHNYPGVATGSALLAEGPVNCASMGIKITLTGKTAHASQPEAGISPAAALARLIPGLGALGQGGALGEGYRLVTLTHATLGVPAFGIAPAHGEIWATLRTLRDGAMAELLAQATALAQSAAAADGLALSITHHDVFQACINDPQATQILGAALDFCAIAHHAGDLPMRASEDFGRFGAGAKAAMLFLGAGQTHPALHNPDYDFPDDLIPLGVRVFDHAIGQILGG